MSGLHTPAASISGPLPEQAQSQAVLPIQATNLPVAALNYQIPISLSAPTMTRAFQVRLKSINSEGAGMTPVVPANEKTILDFTRYFSEARFTELELIVVPTEHMLTRAVSFGAVWLPSGTVPADWKAALNFPGAVHKCFGGPMLSTSVVIPCPFSEGISTIFKGAVTTNYVPTLYYFGSQATNVASSATLSAEQLAEGRLIATGVATISLYIRGKYTVSGALPAGAPTTASA